MADQAPSVAMAAVHQQSAELPLDTPKIRGYDFNKGVDYRALLQSYITTGFQASNMGLAINEINRMVRWPGGGQREIVTRRHVLTGDKTYTMETFCAAEIVDCKSLLASSRTTRIPLL